MANAISNCLLKSIPNGIVASYKKVSESLKPGHINLTKGKLRVESGKGEKDRDLAIPDYLNDLLDTWRNIRPKSNFFFSTLKGRKLSDRYIQQMVKRYAQKAGIEKKISPHTPRHYGELPIMPKRMKGNIFLMAAFFLAVLNIR